MYMKLKLKICHKRFIIERVCFWNIRILFLKWTYDNSGNLHHEVTFFIINPYLHFECWWSFLQIYKNIYGIYLNISDEVIT